MTMTPLSCSSFDAILGSALTHYYGEGFKHWHHSITDIHIDMETLDATAKVSIESTNASDGYDELSTYPISMLDCFLVTLQLAQIMMYELDSVERQNSNTLWMLQTRMNLTSDEHYLTSDEQCSIHVRGKHLLPLRGAMWRNLDITGSYGGIDITCSIAHALPNCSSS
jgi:Pseudomonas avirulence D protein (AvrD)